MLAMMLVGSQLAKKTVTKNKKKMQKRFILDSLTNLHRKFLSENPSAKISYALFCRMRPFFVLLPNLQSRDTCLCKLYDNLAFTANKLVRLHVINSANLEPLADFCSCDPQSKTCMYGLCEICVHKCPVLLCDYSAEMRVSYPQWKSLNEEKKIGVVKWFHDGILYTRSNAHSLIPTSFCTISNSRHHSPLPYGRILIPCLSW